MKVKILEQENEAVKLDHAADKKQCQDKVRLISFFLLFCVILTFSSVHNRVFVSTSLICGECWKTGKITIV